MQQLARVSLTNRIAVAEFRCRGHRGVLAGTDMSQELVDRVSREYSVLNNVDKTKVMASDGIACSIVIQNELLEQVDTFPYLGSLITEDAEC